MGKSIRSKIKKRLRTAKRQRVDAMILTPKLHEHNESLRRVMEGRGVTLLKPKNAFKYPEAPGAVFPQHEVMKPIDFRSSNLPMAAFAFRGNRRKYSGEELEYMNRVAKDHPKMELMAGGGAVLAQSGQRVPLREAELLATAALRPEVAAIAAAGPSTAASAVASAIAEEAEEAEEADAPIQAEKEPENAVDNSRPPVLKDERRAKRAAAHRPRAAKKGKGATPDPVTKTQKKSKASMKV
eukprot:CAMPEP_0170614666 /NCGR_PEP_ID=MMETSP0224-20130122/24926_1 /TAXON_ID=285029 /ORGANISM="Togula jolla, Strain CCCM 725" /LENGTH=239 /DNA_ID=CAMNT_0010940347 /DNA_START=48 /DNA_END=767 /DNA_ORIENTATION=-